MNERIDALSFGDKYGLLGLVVFVAGIAVYDYGSYNSEGFFQSFPSFLVPLAIVLVGVGFFVRSGRAYFRSWKKRNEKVK
jgi:hypothetical protein